MEIFKKIAAMAGLTALFLLAIFAGYLVLKNWSENSSKKYQAEIITEEDNFYADFKVLENGCILIKKSTKFFGKRIYCGRYLTFPL